MADPPSVDRFGRPMYGLDEHGLPWENSLATLMYLLVDPNELISQTYPHLHRVVCRRFNDAMIARGHTEVSRCTHVDAAGISSDHPWKQQDPINLRDQHDRTEDRWRQECQILADAWDRTGFFGEGSK